MAHSLAITSCYPVGESWAVEINVDLDTPGQREFAIEVMASKVEIAGITALNGQKALRVLLQKPKPDGCIKLKLKNEGGALLATCDVPPQFERLSLNKLFKRQEPVVKRGETLVIEGNQVVIKEDIEIKSGGRCIIQAGTQLKFSWGAGILCHDGAIEAIGTLKHPIVFTRESDHGWGNVTLFGAMSSGHFEHCTFEAGRGRNVEQQSGILVPQALRTRASIDEGVSYGGALALLYVGGALTLKNLTFSNNQAQIGGGVYAHRTPLTMADCTWKQNTAQKEGGGLCNKGGDVTLEKCIFRENSADHGGALYLTANQSALLQDVAFQSNAGEKKGGAIRATHGTDLKIQGCTFEHNTSSDGEDLAALLIADIHLETSTLDEQRVKLVESRMTK